MSFKLGVEEVIIQKLHSTIIMQKVLRSMCTKPHNHELHDGWGVLRPWDIFEKPCVFSKIIHECTTTTEETNWRGLNL